MFNLVGEGRGDEKALTSEVCPILPVTTKCLIIHRNKLREVFKE